MLSVGFLAKIHGIGRMRVYKNSTHSSLRCLFYNRTYIKNILVYPHKKYTGIIILSYGFTTTWPNFKRSEDKDTNGIENWSL